VNLDTVFRRVELEELLTAVIVDQGRFENSNAYM